MGSKLTKAKKKGEGEEKTGQVNKDWSTSTWPRKKKPDFNEFKEDKSGTLGRRGKFGKGSTATLGNDSKLDRKPSFGKRIRASARNWASTKGLYKGSKNQHESEADTKPSSVILGQEEEKELEEEEVIAPVEDEVVTSSELDVGALVKELVTQKLKKSKEKADESGEVKVEAQIEANNVKISPRFIEIDSNTAVTTEVYPAENVSQSVCEEDVTAIELIEPGDEIVIATETIVEENENSYTEEKIEVIENSETSSISKRSNSAEILSESVVEENVTVIDDIKNGNKVVTATEYLVEDNENSYNKENIKITDNIDDSSDNNAQALVMLAVSPSELAQDIGDKEETLETSNIGQKVFEINEVPAEVQMEAEQNMDSTTPEISHETEIEEASAIPVKTIVEGDTENATTNSVNIEDISVIVEDVLERDEELNTLKNVDNVLENKHVSVEFDVKNDMNENLDITENKCDLENINNNYELDLSAVNNKDDVANIEQSDLANGTEKGFPPTEKNGYQSNEKISEIETMKEINKCSMTIVEETNDEKEEDEVNISEQLLSNLNNHQELKYITEIEEDNSLETVQEIESFQINEEIQEVRFEASVEFLEFEDQPTRESLTQFEDTPVLETVEEMEEPPMEETETVVLCHNEIAKEWDDGSSIKEKVRNEDSSIPLDHYTIFENENENSVEEDEEDISYVVKSDEIVDEMHSESDTAEVEQKEVLELCANVEATPSEEIVIDSIPTNDNEEESQDISDNDIEFSKQITMEMKETEESEDSMSLEDNLGAQEELVLSEAEEIAQNILDKVFSEITDSAYFEGDDLEGVTAGHEDLLEECVEIDIEEIVESEIQSSVEGNINDKEDCEDEIVKSYKEEFELVKDECQDDSLLDGQNTTPDILELVEEVKESTSSNTESTLQKSTTLGSNNDFNIIYHHEEIKHVEETEKKIEDFQESEKHVDQNEEDLDSHVEEEKNHLDEENELLSQTMQDLSGKLGNTLKLVQEHISVTSDDIVEMEKSKPSDSDFSNLTNTNIDYDVSEDGSDEERTDVSTDEGIVASSDEDEKCHGTKEAIEKRPKNKEDVKDSLDNSCSEFK